MYKVSTVSVLVISPQILLTVLELLALNWQKTSTRLQNKALPPLPMTPSFPSLCTVSATIPVQEENYLFEMGSGVKLTR